jgi:tRNA A37 N6-isopentenylltransferase MiaA
MEQLIYTISRSYSRKFNPENHGITGLKYATEDFFASRNIQIPVAGYTDEGAIKISDELFQQCKQEVEDALNARIEELKGADPALSGTEMAQIAPFLQMIADGKDAADAINKAKDGLSKSQLEFLRNVVRNQ